MPRARSLRQRALTVAALVIANAIPIVGVVAFGWSLLEVMFLFWAESAVIGLFNIARMVRIDAVKGLLAAPFFAAHYGFFMFGHAMFLIVLFAPKPPGRLFVRPSVDIVWDALAPALAGLAAMVVSHGVSFVANFLARREFERTTVSEQVFVPYKRIAVMHVTVILSGWFTMVLKQPIGGLVLLVVIKAGVDVAAHLREHAKRDPDYSPPPNASRWAKLLP